MKNPCFQGIGSGMSFVSVGYVATAWSPTQQRGLFMSFLTMYNQVRFPLVISFAPIQPSEVLNSNLLGFRSHHWFLNPSRASSVPRHGAGKPCIITRVPSPLSLSSSFSWFMPIIQGITGIHLNCINTILPNLLSFSRFVSDREAAYIEGPEASIAVDESLPRVSYRDIFRDPSMIGTFIVATGNFCCFNIFM